MFAGGFVIEMGDSRLDQYGVALAPAGKVQGVGSSRVVHIDGSGRGEHGATGVGVAEGRVAGLFAFVVGFRLHNPGGKPTAPVAVAQDFAEQFACHQGGIIVEKIGIQEFGHHNKRGAPAGGAPLNQGSGFVIGFSYPAPEPSLCSVRDGNLARFGLFRLGQGHG